MEPSHTAGGNVNDAAAVVNKKVKQLAYDSATLLYKTKSIPEILFSCEKESELRHRLQHEYLN